VGHEMQEWAGVYLAAATEREPSSPEAAPVSEYRSKF